MYFPRGIFRPHRKAHQWEGVVACEERHQTPSPLERGMGLVLPTIEAYPVQHLPMVQASADQRGGVEGIKPRVPTAMAIEAGTLVLGMRLETWGGRSPLSRVPEGFARPETALLLGQASRRAGDEERARLELEAARAAFDRLGAELDARTAARLLGGPASRPGGLSDREVQVLRLVASGKSNRQVAAAMVISQHTVSRHLQNIFTKLQVSSRAAATAYAFEHGLL